VAKQSLIWTALPNGFDADGNLRISALVSPRLEPDANQTLVAFPNFVDWPATVTGANFTIHYGGENVSIPGNQTSGPNEHVDGSVDLPDSQAWSLLFPQTTFVRGHAFKDLTDHVILSFDATALNELARNLFAALGKYADELPRISLLLQDPTWRSVINAVSLIDGEFIDESTGLRNVSGQFARYMQDRLALGDPVAELLARAQLFHTPPSTPEIQDYSTANLMPDDPRKSAKWRTFRRLPLPVPDNFSKELDFHQIVAAMNPYPRLLRRLGLVIDFVVPRGKFTNNPDQLLSVTCTLSTPAQGVARAETSPRTHSRLSDVKFDAVTRPGPQTGDYRVIDGLLEMNPNSFSLVQNDVDGSGLKIMNFARTLRLAEVRPARQVDPVTKFEKEIGVPAVRNAGLMLVQRRRNLMLTNVFAYNKTKNTAIQNALVNAPNASAPVLYAEDITRGWRIDIWDSAVKVWRSLCERDSTHLIAGSLTVADDREGMVRLAATKSPDPASNPKLIYLHETLVSWTGWSLVAPQPGRTIDKDDQVADAEAEVPPNIPMESTFTVRTKSLPRLRYGRRYWLRARMTDLAGNSLPPSPNEYANESPNVNATPYFRFEPVQAPALALLRTSGIPQKPAEGESMERLAIRTFNATPADNVIPSSQTAERCSVPARSNVKEAELHGMLDSGGKVDSSQATFVMLSTKDQSLGEVKLLTPGPLTDPGSTVEISYAVIDTPLAGIPYLPDPLCVTIAARLYDHPTVSDSTILSIPVYTSGNTWPNAEPFLIRLIEDPAKQFSFDAANRILEISLPKAVRAKLRLSCKLSGSALDMMGVWDWLPPADRTALAGKAKDGQHWMLTPWRTIELVHAVQKPLISPVLKLTVSRAFGETRALPRFTATCSLNSTARVDLQATWHEPDADAATTPAGTDRLRTDHAYSVKITDAKSYATKKNDPNATGIADHDLAGADLISVGQDAHNTVIKYHEFGDTRYRRIQYWLEATTRFREFMPTSVLTKDEGGQVVETDENIKVTGPAMTTWIPNSAPPPAPQVLYVVPTFGWLSSRSSEGVETRWRRGGGLRVYLDRPWNASGYGEMLAVVLPRASFADDPNIYPSGSSYKKFVTQWGNDPVWASTFVSGPTPKPTNFPLKRTAPDPSGQWLPSFAPAAEADQPAGSYTVTDLPHPGLRADDTTGLVDVVPHDVVYDADRRLWYCDIEITFGASYYPFIRLALARYQPISIPRAHLSNIVMADFAALASDRWLTISQSRDPRVRTISVYGFSFTDSSGHKEAQSSPSTVVMNNVENPATVSPKSIVEVWVEKLDPALGEDFGWKKDSTAVISTGSPAPMMQAPAPSAESEILRLRETTSPKAAMQENLISPISIWPTLWNGTVTLSQAPSAQARYRLVIAEYEEYLVDDATPYNPTPSAKDRRLVFVEHVEL
jgi:hypothetical protein